MKAETPYGCVRRLDPASPDYLRALHDAASVSPGPAGQVHSVVSGLLADARESPTRIGLVVGVYENGSLRTAVAALESPGQSALVLLPQELERRLRQPAMAALREIVDWGRIRRLSVIEALARPDSASSQEVFKGGNFRFLTNLLYLQRSSNDRSDRPSQKCPIGCTWLTYGAETADLFEEAIKRSLEQSLDCPELMKFRTLKQTVETHKAAGVFDPSNWFVCQRAGRPVGVILLSKIRRQPAMEVVYMGVSLPARGTGVADALMERALGVSRQRAAEKILLAVDERNTPARRLYFRWGLTKFAERSAWIATLFKTDACEQTPENPSAQRPRRKTIKTLSEKNFF